MRKLLSIRHYLALCGEPCLAGADFVEPAAAAAGEGAQRVHQDVQGRLNLARRPHPHQHDAQPHKLKQAYLIFKAIRLQQINPVRMRSIYSCNRSVYAIKRISMVHWII